MNFKIKYCLPYYNPPTQKKYYPTQSTTQKAPTPHLRPHPRSTHAARGMHLSRRPHLSRGNHLSSFFTSVSPASTSHPHFCTYLLQTNQQVQTPHTKTPHNQQHVKKDETCSLGMKKKCNLAVIWTHHLYTISMSLEMNLFPDKAS